MREEAKNWIDSSKRDFSTAKYLFDGKRYEESTFFCQQSVEKGLKVLLLKRTDNIIKIHDLVLLSKKLDAPDEIIFSCSKITPAYIDSRYPDLSKTYDKKDAEEIINLTSEILKWIEKNL